MSISSLRPGVEWTLMLALTSGPGLVARAQEEPPQDERPVVQIGQPDAEQPQEESAPGPERDRPNAAPPERDQFVRPAALKYWIGLSGEVIDANHPLRAHVEIPEDQGLLVANIVPDSPAAKAGLKTHDILLRANDNDLRDMSDLVELVLAEGEREGQIALEVLRRGERLTIYVTPEERPADAPRPEVGFGGELGAPGGIQVPQDLLREFGEPLGLEFRNLGPGLVVGPGHRGLAELPHGVSITILRDEGQPPRITVQRGGETWVVEGGDPESLKQLPDDLRPFVEQLLQGGSPIQVFPRPGRGPLPRVGDPPLRERLERMEREIEELRERVLNRRNQAAQQQDRADQDK